MVGHTASTLNEINLIEKPLKQISTSKKVDCLKGSIASATIFFKLECEKWDDFIELLEPIHRVNITSKSPSMPISVNHEIIVQDDDENKHTIKITFTALSGLTYPTLLVHNIEKTTIDMLNKKKQYLEDCGYVTIEGKLSFIKGE